MRPKKSRYTDEIRRFFPKGEQVPPAIVIRGAGYVLKAAWPGKTPESIQAIYKRGNHYANRRPNL